MSENVNDRLSLGRHVRKDSTMTFSTCSVDPNDQPSKELLSTFHVFLIGEKDDESLGGSE